MQVIIDRFEGDYAVIELEDRQMINVPKVLFGDANVNDIIDITINKEKTNNKTKDINSRFEKLKMRIE